MSTLFVTALIDVHKDQSKDQMIDQPVAVFKKLVATGIPLLLFRSKAYEGLDLSPYSNVTVQSCEFEDLWMYKGLIAQTTLESIQLPPQRTAGYDTPPFLILQNSKLDFLERAMSISNATHFAWIDASIFNLVSRPGPFMNRLQLLAKSALQPTFLAIPGCWEKGVSAPYLFDTVNWRFCGNFFIGDRTSLLNTIVLYKTHFIPTVLKHSLIWEVNMWAYLENNHGWTPSWYKGNHNDAIIELPSTHFTVVASLTTIPSRIANDCVKAIDSLLPQVDRIYLSVSSTYQRFKEPLVIPPLFSEEPYASKVTIVMGEDLGPASKYLGALDLIPHNQWMFICDDDQEYKPDLIHRMMKHITDLSAYQNRYNGICKLTSGGLIHGYVGNLTHRSFFTHLRDFPMPPCARHTDDQWMSAYYYFNGITVKPTHIESYNDIFKVLESGYEKHNAADQLSALGTRSTSVTQLAEFMRIQFVYNGHGAVTRILQKELSATKGTYSFPTLSPYQPSSSSFLNYKGVPLLNVRYVNYKLTPNGQYIIHDEKSALRTQNCLMTLGPDLTTVSQSKFLTSTATLPTTCIGINGLEDIRLYESNGLLRFIATQREWSPSRQNRMAIGTINDACITQFEILEPPTPTSCEKNWIPIVVDTQEQFIYKWHPLQIGTLQKGTLKIISEIPTPPLFERVRGSTICQNDSSGNKMFVVHYSDETSPRTYYHMLVVLDKDSLVPLRMSQPFVFSSIGIEFCIGFCLEEPTTNRIRFWYSQHDRDPVWLSVSLDSFVWTTIC